MKIQLDYDAKIITLEDNVNLGEFFDKIKKILPLEEWELKPKTIAHYPDPIPVPCTPYPYPYNPYPTWEFGTYVGTGTPGLPIPPVTYMGGEITTGTHCLEVN